MSLLRSLLGKLLEWRKSVVWKLFKPLAWILLFLVVVLFLLHIFEWGWLSFIHFNGGLGHHKDWIASVHGVSLILLTAVIITVAWHQISGLNKTAKADFLLRIECRYGSPEIVKARGIIHRLWRNCKAETVSCKSFVTRKERRNKCRELMQGLCLLSSILKQTGYFSIIQKPWLGCAVLDDEVRFSF